MNCRDFLECNLKELFKEKTTNYFSVYVSCSASYGTAIRVNIQYDPQRNERGHTPFSTQVLSPEVHDDHTVTFRVRAPNAQTVQLTGSMFIGQNRQRPNFTKGDNGVWELTIGPLTPEIYLYYIVIDGVQNIDANNQFTGHAAMPSFSMLFVHGDEPACYDPKPDVPHGASPHTITQRDKRIEDMIVYLRLTTIPTKNIPCSILWAVRETSPRLGHAWPRQLDSGQCYCRR